MAMTIAAPCDSGFLLRGFCWAFWSWGTRRSPKDGGLTPPMFGRFSGGRGEFFGQDSLQGRAIYVRFVFSELTPSSFRFEQAFSVDGGKSWEVNWIATFTRV